MKNKSRTLGWFGVATLIAGLATKKIQWFIVSGIFTGLHILTVKG